MITVWGRKTSSNVQAVLWCLGELGQDYRRHDIGHRYGGTDTDEFAALNPNRTIPVLQDGSDPPLWETGAILRYLAARYGTETFWPKDLLARTEIDRWAEWSKINIAMAFTGPVFWRVIRTPPQDQNPTAIKDAIKTLEQALHIANTRLEKHVFLASDQFTLADIQFGHILFRYYNINIERATLPYLAQYYAQLKTRLAYQQNVMLSYEELRAC